MMRFLPAIASLFIFPSLSLAIDCSKAKTRTENLICSNSELMKLDQEINSSFHEVSSLLAKDELAKFKEEQKQAVRFRNECEEKWKENFEKKCSSIVEFEMKKNLAALIQKKEKVSLPNPTLLDRDRPTTFNSVWEDRYLGENEPLKTDQSGAWEGSWGEACMPHSCFNSRFVWFSKDKKTSVRALGDIHGPSPCDDNQMFYLVSNSKDGKIPAGSLPPLKYTAKDEFCVKNALFLATPKDNGSLLLN